MVDLLVVEPGGANQLVWPELKQELWAQTGIGGQLPILGKPLGEGPGADAHAEPLLDMDGNAFACVATIVAHEGFEDDSKREGFALGNLGSEDAVAVMATPELDGLELLVALAFPGDAPAMAVETALTLVTDQARVRTGCSDM